MLCKSVLKLRDPSTGKTQIPTFDSTSVDIGKNSKTVYFNDSFYLPCQNPVTETIIDLNHNEETMNRSECCEIGRQVTSTVE
jgi:hypothetical protein